MIYIHEKQESNHQNFLIPDNKGMKQGSSGGFWSTGTKRHQFYWDPYLLPPCEYTRADSSPLFSESPAAPQLAAPSRTAPSLHWAEQTDRTRQESRKQFKCMQYSIALLKHVKNMWTYGHGRFGWVGPDRLPVRPYKHGEEQMKDDQIADCWENTTDRISVCNHLKETSWGVNPLTSFRILWDCICEQSESKSEVIRMREYPHPHPQMPPILWQHAAAAWHGQQWPTHKKSFVSAAGRSCSQPSHTCQH